MNALTITIEAPALAQALNNLAAALGGAAGQQTLPTTKAQSPVPVSAATLSAPAAVAAPPMASPQIAATMQAAPAYAPAPVAAPPAYTLDRLQTAAGQLVAAGKQGELLSLLGKYGVQALTQLPQEQFGAFATDLRALGGLL